MDSRLREMVKQADADPEPNHLKITLPDLDARALQIYAASLYGQSMIWDDIDERDIEEEYCSLIKIHACCNFVGDIHGADESIDAIRRLIREKGSQLESPVGVALEEGYDEGFAVFDLIIDFIVYGNGFVIFDWLYEYGPAGTLEHEYPDFFRRLCKEFVTNATKMRGSNLNDITTVDDLYVCCRYHSHFMHGEPCYMDG